MYFYITLLNASNVFSYKSQLFSKICAVLKSPILNTVQNLLAILNLCIMLINTWRPKYLSEQDKLPLLLKLGWWSSIFLFNLELYYFIVRWYVASFQCLKSLSRAFAFSLHYMDTQLGFRCQHLISYIDMFIVKKRLNVILLLKKNTCVSSNEYTD